MPDQPAELNRPTSLDIPVLVVHDEGDDWVPLEHAHRITAAHEARLVVTRNLGHRGILGQPEVINAAVEFIRPGAVTRSRVTGAE